MFSTRTSIAALAVLALTSAGGAVISTSATATSPTSDYCTNSDSTHFPQSADTAATWLSACHASDHTDHAPAQPYYCTHAYVPYIPHTADAIAEWLSACDVIKR